MFYINYIINIDNNVVLKLDDSKRGMKMKKFNATWKVGDLVKIIGSDTIARINEIHETRNWIKLEGIGGSFQWAHVKKIYK